MTGKLSEDTAWDGSPRCQSVARMTGQRCKRPAQPGLDYCQTHSRPPVEDEELTFDGQPRCTSLSKQTGDRCRRAATPGVTVCHIHGSKGPDAQRQIRMRLAELSAPAITTLGREMVTAQTSADRQKAANSILDRTGFARASKIEAGDAGEILLQTILARRVKDDPEPETIEGNVIEGDSERIQTELEELI